MANEAFALSPISARPVQPSEEDYAAISEAFMETARGRWFLAEYAKRNRNTDTSLVLDAVARLEETLAAQRQAEAAFDPEPVLAEAIAAIRDAVTAARTAATAALEGLSLEQRLAPVRKAARVLREISWRLREIGNDGRICDLIDSQVTAIESGTAELSSDPAKAALDAAFAALADRIASFDEATSGEQEEMPSAVSGATIVPIRPDLHGAVADSSPRAEAIELSQVDEVPAVVAETVAPAPQAVIAEQSAARPSALDPETVLAQGYALEIVEPAAAEIDDEAMLAQGYAVKAVDSVDAAVDTIAADAHDEAVLDRIAMEMGAVEQFDFDDAELLAAEAAGAGPAAIEPAPFGAPSGQATALDEATAAMQAVPAAEASPEPHLDDSEPLAIPAPEIAEAAQPAADLSLGASLLATGVVKPAALAASHPLAALRRMSAAEKIAFFS